MLKVGLIAEGPTDLAVLENILEGFIADDPVINFVQPKLRTDPGGWTLVFRALRDGEARKALQFNDVVVIQIDTDVCEDVGFDVQRRAGGNELSVAELVERVRERLVREMGSTAQGLEGKLFFAVAVDGIECWLLPLLFENEPTKAAKVTGCLAAANKKLDQLGRRRLCRADGTAKDVRAYEEASKDFRKQKALRGAAANTPSLGLFLENLAGLPANEPSENGDEEPA